MSTRNTGGKIRENFGPLRAVFKYQDLDDAVRVANGTPYGLGTSVSGKDPESLDAVARRLVGVERVHLR
ncbi:aldehyde dehydrogenase family protein [Edaphobacter aggregans]|uniref:aldehyde dehydrogenase family protein n=1 Tax=Edaphobacter aggregans TaxID=570835 RepID=UPI0005555303|nr:aldehyde dehydrogenase family protein [Edaphobacter aggregans]